MPLMYFFFFLHISTVLINILQKVCRVTLTYRFTVMCGKTNYTGPYFDYMALIDGFTA